MNWEWWLWVSRRGKMEWKMGLEERVEIWGLASKRKIVLVVEPLVQSPRSKRTHARHASW